jgi:hypothetical protein
MRDFTNAIWRSNRFGGSERKQVMIYEGKSYLVKFPDPSRSAKVELDYMNNQFSEYVGCHIFNCLDIPVQNTMLGLYRDDVKKTEKIVVACEIFGQTDEGRLVEFSRFLLNEPDSKNRATLNIEDVEDVIATYDILKDKESITHFFWDMFVVDALIGNTDRHFDNWGLIETAPKAFSPAPVYDCGSSLSPLVSDEQKRWRLEHPGEFKNKEYNVCSVYRMGGQRVFYHEIMKNPPDGLRAAILRIVPCMTARRHQIDEMIDGTEGLSEISKAYMKKSLAMRLDQILIPSYRKINA